MKYGQITVEACMESYNQVCYVWYINYHILTVQNNQKKNKGLNFKTDI